MTTLALSPTRPSFLRRAGIALAAAATLFASACAGMSGSMSQPAGPDVGLYELRTYTTNPGKMDALDARFREHTISLFRRHGMTPIAFFHVYTPAGAAIDNRLVYVMGYKDRAARDLAWKEFAEDPEWQQVYKASEANGAILVKPPESIFLNAADYAPKLNLEPSVAPRHFELRTYTANPGKLENIHDRFRNHTIGIFTRLGMTNFMYWRPVADQPAMTDKMVYMLAYPTPAARTTMWQAFGTDPEWVKVRDDSEKDGALLKAPGGVVSVQLTPTDYSPVK
jgi:hypothetical protein